MEVWRHGRNDETVELPQIDDNPELTQMIRRAYDQQNKIGWQHFQLGRLAKEWRRCIRICYVSDTPKVDGRAEGCIRRMIESLWRMMLNVWKIRNDIVHWINAYHSSRDIREMTEIIDKLYDKYQQRADESERWIFKMKRNERKIQSVAKMATWIGTVSTMYVQKKTVGSNNLQLNITRVLRRISIGSIFDE